MTRLEKCKLAVKKGIKYNELTGDITGVKGFVLKAKDNQGYICFGLWHNNRSYNLYGHQFAWYCLYGKCIPMIDHKNRVKTDNRKVNLRKATRQLNSLNRDSKGVSFDKSSGSWLAQIMIKGKNIHLGRFKDINKAKSAYINKKTEILKTIIKNNE